MQLEPGAERLRAGIRLSFTDDELAQRFTETHGGPNPYYACRECGESVPGVRNLLVEHAATHGVAPASVPFIGDDAVTRALAAALLPSSPETRQQMRRILEAAAPLGVQASRHQPEASKTTDGDHHG